MRILTSGCSIATHSVLATKAVLDLIDVFVCHPQDHILITILFA